MKRMGSAHNTHLEEKFDEGNEEEATKFLKHRHLLLEVNRTHVLAEVETRFDISLLDDKSFWTKHYETDWRKLTGTLVHTDCSKRN